MIDKAASLGDMRKTHSKQEGSVHLDLSGFKTRLTKTSVTFLSQVSTMTFCFSTNKMTSASPTMIVRDLVFELLVRISSLNDLVIVDMNERARELIHQLSSSLSSRKNACVAIVNAKDGPNNGL